MYKLYQPSTYNTYIKDLRKNKNMSIQSFAAISSYSPASISLFENDNDILNSDKLDYILSFYSSSQNDLIEFDKNITILVENFIHDAVFLDDVNIAESKNKIDQLIRKFESTSLYSIQYLIEFIYNLYNYVPISNKLIKNIENNCHFYVSKYRALFKIYLGAHYLERKEYSLAKTSFDEASFYLSKEPSFEDLYHYFLASYYVFTSDIPKSIYHCEEAIILFSKTQNFNRLSNLNIITANQYLKLKDYKKALSINLNVLQSAVKNGDNFSFRVANNNIGFIYMMQSNFLKAEEYYSKIPIEYMKESHYYSYMICLTENDHLETAAFISNKGSNIATTPYYKYFFKIYSDYFANQNFKKLAKNIEKAFEEFDDYLDIFEREFLCVLLANQYKRLGNMKKALDCYEKLHELNYSS